MPTDLVRRLTANGWDWVVVESGGGGGDLPDWWTVDSTPGSESVTFAGGVWSVGNGAGTPNFYAEGAAGDDTPLLQFYNHAAEDQLFEVGPTGAVRVTITDPDLDPFRVVGGVAGEAQFIMWSDGGVQISRATGAASAALTITDPAGTLFEVGPTGAVMIAAPAGVIPLTINVDGDLRYRFSPDASGFQTFSAAGLNVVDIAADHDGPYLLRVFDPLGGAVLNVRYVDAEPQIGFLGNLPSPQRPHIGDPSGGGTQDTEARAAIVSLLNLVETFGLMAA